MLYLLSFIFIRDYPFLLFMSFVGGIAAAFMSGTLDTLIYDQMADEGKEKEYPHVTSKAQQMLFLGRAGSTYLGGVLFAVSAVLPYIAYVIANILSAISVSRMKEDNHHRVERQIKETFGNARTFLLQRKDILYVCVVGLIFTLFTDLLFGYFQPYFTTIGYGSAFIGTIFMIISLSSAYGSHLMKRSLAKYTFKQINAFAIILSIIATILLFSQHIIFAFLAAIILGIAFGTTQPNLRHLLNNETPKGIKTSVLSFGGTFYNIGTTIGLFFAGFFADRLVPTEVLTIILAGCFLSLLLNARISLHKNVDIF